MVGGGVEARGLGLAPSELASLATVPGATAEAKAVSERDSGAARGDPPDTTARAISKCFEFDKKTRSWLPERSNLLRA